MKRIEKLAIVLIVAGLLQGPALWCLLHYSPALLQSGGKGLSLLQEIMGFASAIATSLVSVGCAIWLYLEADRSAYSKWVWCLLGLLFRLPAVAIFYGVAILYTLRTNTDANQQSEGIRR